jgi:hypothetical protein
MKAGTLMSPVVKPSYPPAAAAGNHGQALPQPVLDDRFALIAQIITDTMAEHGYAEMRNVPGDQHAALRKQVRSAVRQRTGRGFQTLVHESMVIFICEPISQPRPGHTKSGRGVVTPPRQAAV